MATDKDVEVVIAQQLMALASDDDQLGRGEYELCEVQESARSDSEFIVIARSNEEGAPKRCYRVIIVCDEEERV